MTEPRDTAARRAWMFLFGTDRPTVSDEWRLPSSGEAAYLDTSAGTQLSDDDEILEPEGDDWR